MTKIGGVQRSQLITTFGIGSIMDVPNYSVVMAGQEFWIEHKLDVIREERLEKKLKVQWFKQPSVPNGSDDYGCIPAFRFPEWVFCPKCKRLAPYSHFGDDNVKYCPRCSTRKSKQGLMPARFVVSCANGHLDDFPWEWWVHRGESCASPKLKIMATGRSTSLGNIYVKCFGEGCESSGRSLAGIFSKNALKSFGGCTGGRPWLGKGNYDKCTDDLPPKVLQRGSASVYFPIVNSAISIPPFSERIHTFLRGFDEELEFLADTMLKPFLKKKLEKSGDTFDLDLLVKAVGVRKEKSDQDDGEDLRPQEYEALCNPGPKDAKAEFSAVPEAVPAGFEDKLSKVVLVHRLREVRALTSFTRVDPNAKNPSPISEQKQNWLPGTEIRGEGIFVEFDSECLNRWIEAGGEKLKVRVANQEKKRQRLVASNFGFGFEKEVTSKFLLIHTLAHLLIMQLIIDCGYSSSALRERIYVSDGRDRDCEMNGFLIYTATADSEGSLGGLVRQGKVSRFGEVLKKALEKAQWCSNDPLCMESTGQGLNSLNLAACHSCVLLPETACEFRNCILDRAVVVGHPDNTSLGYFSLE